MRLIEYFLKPNRRVIYLYRLSERIREKNRFCRVCSTIIRNHLKVKYAIEFNNDERIGSGLKILHFNGITVGDNAIVGPNTVLFENLGPGEIAVSAKYQTIVKKNSN